MPGSQSTSPGPSRLSNKLPRCRKCMSRTNLERITQGRIPYDLHCAECLKCDQVVAQAMKRHALGGLAADTLFTSDDDERLKDLVAKSASLRMTAAALHRTMTSVRDLARRMEINSNCKRTEDDVRGVSEAAKSNRVVAPAIKRS